ncbi:MAG: arylsulfatase [Verrucomicrobiota bacterium]
MRRLISFPMFFIGFFVLAISLNAKKPNIVIYMADDLGWGSTSPYGADPALVKTPHISRLAEQGVTFDNASTTASVCSPTRYAMLTGQYSWRTHLKSGVVNSFDPLLINPETPTVASWLQDRGYRTAQFGKWHLGYKSERFDNLLGEIRPGPNDVGFDYHFGVPNNMDDLHKVYIENRSVYGLRSDRISPYGRSYYGTQYFGYDAPQRDEPMVMAETTQRAIDWINQKDADKPFFLYFGAVAVHHPVMPSPENFGSSPAGTYGDFIHDTDDSVGAIMAALEARGELDNTVFIFTSDNGGDIPNDKKYNRPEVQALEAGLDINGDWRGDKHMIYEGGLRVPLIVAYPQAVKGGLRSNAVVSTADLFATIAEIDGVQELPADTAPDSFSFARVLLDPKKPSDRQHLVMRDAQGRQALRFGPWKLIDDAVPGKKPKKVELYNLEQDPAETEDVSKQFPEVVAEGKKLLQAIRDTPSSRTVGATN